MSNHIFKSTKDLTDAVSGHVFKFTKDKANDASGNIFKSAKDKTDNVSSSQPLPSIEPLSPPRHSTIISSTQPLPATIKHDDNSEASNQDPTNNRRNISIQEIDSVQQSLAHNSIRDDLVNSLDARQATPEFSRRTNYDNREELLGKRSRHYRSDHVDDILLSLSRPKNYDDIYTDYDRNERIRSTMQAKIDSLIKENMALREDNSLINNKFLELDKKAREDKARYQKLQLEMEKMLLHEQEKMYQASQKIKNVYENAIARFGKVDNINELRITEKINELMNYLTSVTVNDVTEKENEIIFDCEITSQPKKRSFMFKLGIPNDDTKAVDYTPNMDQLDERLKADLPDFFFENISFAKQGLPIFFWRLSSSIQGTPD